MLPSLVSGNTPFKNRLANPVIIINSKGVGDFTSLQDALDAGHDFIYLDDIITENITIPVGADVVMGGRGQLIGDIVCEDANLILQDGFRIDGNILISGVNVRSDLAIYRAFIDGRITVQGTSPGHFAVLTTYAGAIITPDFTKAINPILMTGEANQAQFQINPGSIVKHINMPAIQINDDTGTTVINPGICYAYLSEISNGFGASIDSTVAVTLNIYLCKLAGAVGANVTLGGGGNEYT